MTRRRFNADGKIQSDLLPYVEAIKKLAADKAVPLIDLHARSIAVLDELGPKASEELDAPPSSKSGQPPKPDKTHLSPKGADVMGKLVAEDLKKVEPDLRPYIQ
jgi:pectinesterase